MNSSPVRRFGNLYVVAGILVGSAIGIGVYQYAFHRTLPSAAESVAIQPPLDESVPSPLAVDGPVTDQTAAAGTAVSPDVAAELIVSGVATVSPSQIAKSHSAKAVFVMIRSAQPGPPFAVKRFDNPHSDTQEISFVLTTSDIMNPGAMFPNQAVLRVRFDADGIAGPMTADDVEGFVNLEKSGSKDIKIAIQ